MIETNEVGQKILEELIASRDSFPWKSYEISFLESMVGKRYKNLTTKQKAVLTELYDRLLS